MSSPTFGRQPVLEGDPGALAGRAAHGRAGEAAAEGPEPGLAAGQDLLLGLDDRDPDLVAAEDRRDRQRRPERDRRLAPPARLAERQRPAAPAPQRQEDRERAAAEGAEEGSAPQAGP